MAVPAQLPVATIVVSADEPPGISTSGTRVAELRDRPPAYRGAVS
jgi:hypothetical protein